MLADERCSSQFFTQHRARIRRIRYLLRARERDWRRWSFYKRPLFSSVGEPTNRLDGCSINVGRHRRLLSVFSRPPSKLDGLVGRHEAIIRCRFPSLALRSERAASHPTRSFPPVFFGYSQSEPIGQAELGGELALAPVSKAAAPLRAHRPSSRVMHSWLGWGTF